MFPCHGLFEIIGQHPLYSLTEVRRFILTDSKSLYVLTDQPYPSRRPRLLSLRVTEDVALEQHHELGAEAVRFGSNSVIREARV